MSMVDITKISEAFEIKCRKCGSTKFVIDDDVRSAYDGPGRVDVWGDISLKCADMTCGNSVVGYFEF